MLNYHGPLYLPRSILMFADDIKDTVDIEFTFEDFTYNPRELQYLVAALAERLSFNSSNDLKVSFHSNPEGQSLGIDKVDHEVFTKDTLVIPVIIPELASFITEGYEYSFQKYCLYSYKNDVPYSIKLQEPSSCVLMLFDIRKPNENSQG